MKAPAHFFALRSAVLPKLEFYHRDLLMHDRRVIRRNRHTPFIHVTRKWGTHICMLLPAGHPSWPKKGQEVPYLFGHATREHILRDKESFITYFERHHPDAAVHSFDGTRLRSLSLAQARRILSDYCGRIETAWSKAAKPTAVAA